MIGLVFPAIAIVAALAAGLGASAVTVGGLTVLALVAAVNVYDRAR